MPMPLSARGQTDTGRVHKRNEDSHSVLLTSDGAILLLVCDGMGGQGRGDEASRIAVEVITTTVLATPDLDPRDRLDKAIMAADERIRDELCLSEIECPGSTAAAGLIVDGQLYVSWVGDSRVYLVRDGQVIARTRDHKLVQEMIDAGQMTQEEAKRSKLRSILTNSLGARLPGPPPVRVAHLDGPFDLKTNDRILVCSDGLYDLVDDEELSGMLADDKLDATTQRLIDLANERGGHDNITTVLGAWNVAGELRVTEVGAPPRRTNTPTRPWSAPLVGVVVLLVVAALSVAGASLF